MRMLRAETACPASSTSPTPCLPARSSTELLYVSVFQAVVGSSSIASGVRYWLSEPSPCGS